MKKNKKKKLAVFLPNLKIGGAEKVSLLILNNLSQEYYTKYLVVLDMSGINKKKISKNINIINLKKPKLSSNFFKIYQLINKKKFDIVFSTFFHINFFLCILKFFLNFKLIIRESNDPKYIIKKNSKSFLISIFYRYLYPKADKIIVPGKYLIKRLMDLSIPKYKIKKIYNPVYKNKNINFKNKNKYYCAIGRLTYQKGFDELIDLVNHSDLKKLMIIGNGPEKKELIKISNKKKIIFVKETKIKNYLLNSKALLFSSRWEGMPNVVLESLMYGTKILSTSRIESILELKKIIRKNSIITCTNKNFNKTINKIDKENLKIKKNLLPIDFQIKFAINEYQKVLY